MDMFQVVTVMNHTMNRHMSRIGTENYFWLCINFIKNTYLFSCCKNTRPKDESREAGQTRGYGIKDYKAEGGKEA